MEPGSHHRTYKLSYSASSGLFQTAANAGSEILDAASTKSRSSRCERKLTKSTTSAILSGGSAFIFSSSSLSCMMSDQSQLLQEYNALGAEKTSPPSRSGYCPVVTTAFLNQS